MAYNLEWREYLLMVGMGQPNLLWAGHLSWCSHHFSPIVYASNFSRSNEKIGGEKRMFDAVTDPV